MRHVTVSSCFRTALAGVASLMFVTLPEGARADGGQAETDSLATERAAGIEPGGKAGAEAQPVRQDEAGDAGGPEKVAEAVPPAGKDVPAGDESVASAAKEAVERLAGKLKIKGYAQLRYSGFGNLFGWENEKFASIGKGFALQRARLALSGDIHPRVSVYLQSDFASLIGDVTHATVMRDWYADLFLTGSKSLRFRVGQSKVPFGFENLQSSSVRLSLDRTEAIGSAQKDQRDIGVFFYAANDEARKRFKELTELGLKGTGDYGVLGLGVYNGQSANRKDLNDGFYYVARLTYPFKLGGQFIEAGLAAYTGQYTLKKEKGTGGLEKAADRRAGAHFVLYPQPFGIQAEYNVGTGPQLERVGAARTPEVEQKFLHGGYVLASYKAGGVIPYVRGSLYDGGRKFETDAPRQHVREVETGVEWTVIDPVKLTGAFLVGKRVTPQGSEETGKLLRAQLQFSY